MTYSLTSNLKGIVSIVNKILFLRDEEITVKKIWQRHSQMIFQSIPRNTNYMRHLISDFSTVTDGAVDIVTRLQVGKSGLRIAAGRTDSGANPASYLIGTWIISRRLKRLGH